MDAGAPDPLALVRALGPIHGEPIAFSNYEDRAAGRLVFLGDDKVSAAWAILDTPRVPTLRAVDGWPLGVRVRFGVATDEGHDLLVLVETVPALDRPARQRSAVVVSRGDNRDAHWTVRPFPVRALERLASVVDPQGLLAAYNAGQPRELPAARCNALRAAARTPAGLPRVASSAGIHHFTRFADGLVFRTETLTAAGLAASPFAPAMSAAVARTAEGACDDDAVDVLDTPAGLRLQAVVTDAVAPTPTQPLPPTSAPRMITAQSSSSSIEPMAHARFPGEVHIVGSAPLTDRGGTVAVATVDAPEPNVALVDEGGVLRVFPLGHAVNINDDRVTAVRFLDANGDGRTDIAVESASPTASPDAGAQGFSHRGLYLSPVGSLSASLSYDLASAVVMNTAADLDAAVAALASVPWRPVTPAQACPLVTATGAEATLRAVSTPALRVAFFEEPETYAWRTVFRQTSEREQASPWWSGVVGCQHLVCDPHRPVCTAHAEPGPASNAYWFTWDNNRLRLAAYALYAGS